MRAAPIFRSARALRRHLDEQGAGVVVLANGCFDPLHVGHIRYLIGAKEHGETLIVALNNDTSTKRLKGDHRPILPEKDRARLVANLKMVDAVLIFGASDVVHILKTVRPDYHAKGTDYTVDTVPEIETSRALGINTVIVGDPKSHASSEVVRRIRNEQATGR